MLIIPFCGGKKIVHYFFDMVSEIPLCSSILDPA